MKKRTIFISSLFVLLIAFLFTWQTCVSEFLQWQAKNISKKVWGTDLHAKKFYKEGSLWIFEKISIPSHDEKPNFTAEKMCIEFSFDPLHLLVNLKIKIENPEIYLHKFNETSQEFVFPFFRSKIDVELTNAELNWLTHKANFDLKCSIGKKKELSLNGKFASGSTFELNCKKAQSKNIIQTHLKNIDCEAISSLAKLFELNLWGWESQQGIITANLDLNFLKNELISLNGKGNFSNLKFTQKNTGLSGNIEEASFEFVDNQEINKNFSLIPCTEAKIEISKSSTIHIYQGDLPDWHIYNLNGLIQFKNSNFAQICFKGDCVNSSHKFALDLRSYANLKDNFGDLSLSMLNSKNEKGIAHFYVKQLDSKNNCAEIELSKIGPLEFSLLKAILRPHFPVWKQLYWHSGDITAQGIAKFQGLQVSEIMLNYVCAQDISVLLEPWDISGQVGSMVGNFSAKFDPEIILDSVNSNFAVQNAKVTLKVLRNQLWTFSKISTDLAIKNGVIQKSILKGVSAGLHGVVELDCLAAKDIIKIHLQGDTKEITAYTPEWIKKGIEKKFANDFLILEASVHKKGSGAEVIGSLNVFENSQSNADKISFGFDLNKSSEVYLQEWQAYNLELARLENVGQEALHQIWPAIAQQLDSLKSTWMKNPSGIAGFVIRNGWFDAKNLPAEKYLSPFLYSDDYTSLSGIGNFKGNFDQSRLEVAYSGSEVTLDNADFTIKIPQIGEKEHLTASHYFDFEHGTGLGLIPFKNATFVDKSSQLIVNNLNSLVVLEGQKVYFTESKMNCEGLFISGNIEVDYSKSYEVEIYTQAISGNMKQVRNIFSHFSNSNFFMQLPLEGKIQCLDEIGYLCLKFSENDCLVTSHINGKLYEGNLHSNDIHIQDLSCNFEYNQSSNNLNISDLQGNLYFGKSSDKYSFFGDYIKFTNYETKEGEFDFWVSDLKHDILRLVGKTVLINENLEVFLDNSLSHFGELHPKKFHLSFHENNIKNFELEIDFQFSNLLQQIQNLSKTEILPINFDELSFAQNNNENKFHLKLNYDDTSGIFNYRINGDKICLGDYTFKKVLLYGKRYNQTWSIDQLILDDISCAADVAWIQDRWVMKFLGIRYQDSLLVGLEGEFLDQKTFQGRVNLLEIDFEKLPQTDSLVSFINQFSPKGKVFGEGNFTIFLEQRKKLKCFLDSNLNLKVCHCELHGLRFKDTDNITCHITPNNGVIFSGIKTSIINDKEEIQASINIQDVRYSFGLDELTVNKLAFKIPIPKLQDVADNLKIAFPEIFTPNFADMLCKIKQDDHLEGSLDLDLTPPYCAARINLKDANYNLWDSTYELRNCVIEYNPFGLQMTTAYMWEATPVWMRAQSNILLQNGVITFSEKHPDLINEQNSKLNLKWENDPYWGFLIREAKGIIYGLNVNLILDHNTPMSLETVNLLGSVDIDVSKTVGFFPKEMREKLNTWQVGKGYTLNGLWKWNKIISSSLARKINFSGSLIGTNFELKGYVFQKLKGELRTTHNSLIFKNISIEDPSLILNSDQIHLSKDEFNNWEIDMPLLNVQKFRPSILKTLNNEVGYPKPLLIKNLEVHKLRGKLSDTNTLKGYGSFNFSNRSRKLLQNTIFQIPVEILSRIGLDLAVLTPVTGGINFTIGESKIILNNFKDIYSEGKLSKFYLPNNNVSYVDFDGNLHMQVRMKQYNLVFKLAELFTVTIQGTLTKPTYSLQRQPNKEWQKLLPIPFKKDD